jgi:hypothetical protein
VDGVTLGQVEQAGVLAFLEGIAAELCADRSRPTLTPPCDAFTPPGLPLSRSAIDGGPQGSASLNHAYRIERADAIYKVSLRNNPEIVERGGAIGRHAIINA